MFQTTNQKNEEGMMGIRSDTSMTWCGDPQKWKGRQPIFGGTGQTQKEVACIIWVLRIKFGNEKWSNLYNVSGD